MPQPPVQPVTGDLADLAHAYGVATSYEDQQRRAVHVPAETIRAVLAAMGIPAGDDAAVAMALHAAARRNGAVLPPSVVARVDEPTDVRVGSALSARLEMEDGAAHELRVEDGRVRVPAGGPTGYHHLVVETADALRRCALIAVPPRCPLPPGAQWGWMLQLYQVRGRDSWGVGEFADLAELARWTADDLGGGFIVCNPLHAVAPVLPQQPSPYFPSSRRFTNPLYLRIEALPELAALEPDVRARVAALAGQARASNLRDRIDRDATFRAKREAWALLYDVRVNPARARAFDAYCRREGEGLVDFATFSALAEQHGAPYQQWPRELQHPRSPAVARAREALADRVRFHMWLQWLCDEQLAQAQEAGARMPVGIVHDLAIGVDPGGADAWALQDDLASGVTVGAPPDMYNQQGQDWQLPPLLPHRLAETAYAPFRDMLRSVLRHAGGIRIDHVMGLFRLFWIPRGAVPRAGTYVRYPSDAMLGVLALEATRAGAVVVGEDLGTVEEGVRDALRERGVLSSRVLYFERTEPDERDVQPAADAPLPSAQYPELALASVNTHDLPTAAGWWGDEWLRVQRELALLGEDSSPEQEAQRTAAEREELAALLRDEGLVDEDASPRELVLAMYDFLARTPCRLVAAALADAVGDTRQPNMPGTSDEYPNWRLPLRDPERAQPLLLEDLRAHPGVAALVDVLRAQGRGRGHDR